MPYEQVAGFIHRWRAISGGLATLVVAYLALTHRDAYSEVAAAVTFLAFCHGAYRMRRPGSSPLDSIPIDATIRAALVLIINPPPVTTVPPVATSATSFGSPGPATAVT